MAKKYIAYEESLKIIELEINRRLVPNQTNFVLIWGASAVGKTTIARQLATRLDDSSIISVDSYLTESLLEKKFNHNPTNSIIPYIEGLDPTIWDLKTMNYDLKDLSLGNPIKIPIYNYTTKNRDGYLQFKPKRIVFLEGSYSMDNSISDTAILSILIHADLHDRLIRKMVRTLNINHRTDIDSSIYRYLTQTNPSLKYYTNLYKKRSNFIVHNPLDPTREFTNLSSSDTIQLGSYVLLVPKITTGTVKHGEQLRFYTDSNELVYIVDNRVIFANKIEDNTYKLLTKYYTGQSTQIN
jgi:uridine kinase